MVEVSWRAGRQASRRLGLALFCENARVWLCLKESTVSPVETSWMLDERNQEIKTFLLFSSYHFFLLGHQAYMSIQAPTTEPLCPADGSWFGVLPPNPPMHSDGGTMAVFNFIARKRSIDAAKASQRILTWYTAHLQ